MYRRYLTAFFTIALFPFLLMGGNVLFLNQTGELLPLDAIVRSQERPVVFTLYGTALHDNTYAYKLKLVEKVRPRIVALGSSRIIQIRSRFFKESFVNAAGPFHSVDHAWHFTQDLLKIHKPEVVIIGLDFWWFRDGFRKTVRSMGTLDKKPLLTLDKICMPWRWLRQGKISLKDYLTFLPPFRIPGAASRLGVSARFKNSGLGPDGSYYYTDVVTGNRADYEDVLFKNTLARIQNGNARFQYADHIGRENLERFLAVVDRLESLGIRVVLLFPPLAPDVHRAMQRIDNRYGYIRELKDELRRHGVNFFDFQDPETLSASSCEFIDGFHCGDLTLARMIRVIGQSPGSALGGRIDVSYLDSVLSRYRDIAMIPDKRVTDLPEVDFLKIKCQK